MKVRDLVTVSSDAIDEMFAFEAHRSDKGVKAVIVLKKLDIRLEFAADMFVAFAARVDESPSRATGRTGTKPTRRSPRPRSSRRAAR